MVRGASRRAIRAGNACEKTAHAVRARFIARREGPEVLRPSRCNRENSPKDSAHLVFRAHTRSARVDGEGQGCSAWWTERARAGSGTPDPQAPTERSGSAGPKRSEGFLGVAVPLTSTN